MTPQAFIDALRAPALASAKATGVPASFAIAEAALESGWGSSLLAREAFNLFGVKADKSWHGDVYTLPTREYLNGHWVMVPARWRKYTGWGGALGDHAAFLRSNPRYLRAFQAPDAVAFTRAVAEAGYATDPDYADKIIAVMYGRRLLDLDKESA